MSKVLLQVTVIGYVINDEHTVGYSRRIRNFLGGNCSRKFKSSDYELVFGESFDEALKTTQGLLLKSLEFLHPVPDDIYFQVGHSDILNNICWPPAGSYGRKYRLSDLEQI